MIKFSEKKIKQWEKEKEKFVLPELSDELIALYEITRLSDCIPMRAEKYESPENSELRNQFKPDEVPLGIQNPNFTVLTDLVMALHKTKSNENLEKLLDFVKIYTEFKNNKYNYIPDIRSIDNLDLLIAYFKKNYSD